MKKNKSVFIGDSLDKCYLCGAWKSSYTTIEEHHVFGGSCRKASDRRGLLVHICSDCHHALHNGDQETVDYLHQRGQMIYEEKMGTRKQFIDEFIRSYL